MRTRFAPILGGIIVVLAAVSVSGFSPAPEPETFARDYLLQPVPITDGCIDCIVCTSGHRTQDLADPTSAYAEYPDGIHGCKGDASCWEHGVCGGGSETFLPLNSSDPVAHMEGVRAGLLSGDWEGLRALLSSNADVALVSERRAIQVTGCEGRVVGHFPLSGIEVALLQE